MATIPVSLSGNFPFSRSTSLIWPDRRRIHFRVHSFVFLSFPAPICKLACISTPRCRRRTLDEVGNGPTRDLRNMLSNRPTEKIVSTKGYLYCIYRHYGHFILFLSIGENLDIRHFFQLNKPNIFTSLRSLRSKTMIQFITWNLLYSNLVQLNCTYT